MNREDIIKLARDYGAGLSTSVLTLERSWVFLPDDLEHFFQAAYAAGADAERKKVRASMKRAFRRTAAWIRADEREVCAKLCEAYTDNDGGTFIDHEGHGYACAAAIRARGQA